MSNNHPPLFHIGRLYVSGSAVAVILLSLLFSFAVYKIDSANTNKSNQTSAQVRTLAWKSCNQVALTTAGANARWARMQETLSNGANTLDQLAAVHTDGTAVAEKALADEWRGMANSVHSYPVVSCGPRP